MRRPPNLSMIEPLESRIAPAAVVFNAIAYNDVVNTKTHVTESMINAASSGLTGANAEIAAALGDSPDVFFFKLSGGQQLQVDSPVQGTLINVAGGNVVAVFTDSTGNASDPVLGSQLTGLSLGTKTSVAVGGGVYGDVVANYNDKTGYIGNTDASALLANTVSKLSIAGSVTGAFIAGGNVSSFSAQVVGQVLTGTAANGHNISFETAVTNISSNTLNVPTPLPGVSGPSISNVSLNSATLISTGAGGAGAAGGSISGLTLIDQTGALTVQAGAGGAGVAGKTGGGTGGSISKVVVEGIAQTTSNLPLILQAGAGGTGYSASNGRGGTGGSVSNVNIGNGSIQSALFLTDNVLVQGGAGGNGGTAGTGGSLSNISVVTSTIHDTTPNAIEFQLLGGAGGNSLSGGRGGAGGSVNTATVMDMALFTPPQGTTLPDDTVSTSPTNVLVLVQAGAGGYANVSGSGGAGGSLDHLTLQGYNLQLGSGAGGNGVSSGGAAGNVENVTVLGSSGTLSTDDFHTENLIITGGRGGDGSNGSGGAGGSVETVTIQNADFGNSGPSAVYMAGQYTVESATNLGLSVTAGSGGNAGKGSGGNGGVITNLNAQALDFPTVSHPIGEIGLVALTSGSGGNAPVAGGKGGNGGAISNVTFVGTRVLGTSVSTGSGGNGGNASNAGKGGNGGTMTNVAIRTAESLLPSTTTASTGELYDNSTDFTIDNIALNDLVTNTYTGQTAYVTSISTNALGLTSDIFAAGDTYAVDGNNGYAGDDPNGSQDTIIDANADFYAYGVNPMLNQTVEDLSDFSTATITGIISATELQVSADISHVGDQYTILPLAGTLSGAVFTAGSGGAGYLTGAGGAGGSIVGSSGDGSTSLTGMPGPVSFYGGTGGAGGITSGASGAGGSLTNDLAASATGAGYMQAGDASSIGAKPGAGGSITHGTIDALTDVTFIAGHGYAGGAGGSVTKSGFDGIQQGGEGFNPPTGNIMVQAGIGGNSSTGNGGAGGSINTLSGFVSAGDGYDSFTTAFIGGAGGSGQGSAGAGGSVSNIQLFGGGGPGVTFYIDAGDAGATMTGKTGATGGSVTNVSSGAFTSASGDPNFSINPLTNFHHISAGDGGSAMGNVKAKGGLGGSVSNVYVNGTIGVRTGVPFGFDLSGAGGISAGAGGQGAGTNGLAGNVTNIAADAIASIVAGHLNVGDALYAGNLATNVSNIILNGTNALNLTHEFQLSFMNGAGDVTVTLPTNATGVEVAAALNALPSIQTAGGVTVTAGAGGTYTVTFNSSGSQAVIAGIEPVVSANGVTTEVQHGVHDLMTPKNDLEEIQSISAPSGAFSLTFTDQNGVTQTTPLLPVNASPGQVENALNSLSNIPSNGVYVAQGTATSAVGYTIYFDNYGPQAPIQSTSAPFSSEVQQGNGSVPEIQDVQVPAGMAFSLSFDGQTTTPLTANDTASDVQSALNNLSNLSPDGISGVTYVAAASANANPYYEITFKTSLGNEPLITPNLPVAVANVQGTTNTPSVQTITLPARGDIDPVAFSTANFVGSIENVLSPTAGTFLYTGAGSSFQFGDVPVNGLIASLSLGTKNFIPNAWVTESAGAVQSISNPNILL